MGGDCIGSDLVWYSTGIDYVKAVIQVACGKNLIWSHVVKRCTLRQYIFLVMKIWWSIKG